MQHRQKEIDAIKAQEAQIEVSEQVKQARMKAQEQLKKDRR